VESPIFFLQFVSRRYELGSIIIISHQRLGAWGGVFDDPTGSLRR
jgi:hypothetical protein